MNRRDYRKLMNVKKRNKNYAKLTILASLGLGVALANSTTVKAETRDWTPNTSTTIKQGDKQYTIKWGDYLSLISKDSGLTIETLMKLNDSILDADLIYEGNIIYFGDGVNAIVKDTKGNVMATTPLTEADKQGIKQADAQKVNRASKTEDKKKNNNSKVNVVNNGNGTGTVTKPNPTKPVNPTAPTTKPDEGKPKPPVVKPDSQEVSMKVYYLQVASTDDLENAVILKEETIKAKKGEKVTVKAKEFDNMNLISDSSITVTADSSTEIIFNYVHEDAREVTVRSITEGGVVLDEFIETDFDILVGEEISYIAGEFEGYELVSDEEQTIIIDTDNAKNVIEFVYREKEVVPNEKVNVTIEHKGTDEVILSKETKQVEKDTTITEKALDFTDRGYELIGEDTQTITADKDATITFEYKKTDTKPEVETVDVEVTYTDVDTKKAISKETVKVELDKDGKGELVAVTPKDYELVGETKAEITKDTKTVNFDVKKVKEVKEITVQAVYHEVDKDGKVVKVLGTESIKANEGDNVKAEAKSFGGYTLQSPQSQVLENAKDGDKIVFNYIKDYVPIHTEETVTVVIDTDGNNLGSVVPNGYTVISESTDGGKTTTAENGDTHTVYTKTITVKKDYVPVHKDEYKTVNVDVNGTPLSDTSNYDFVSESTDGGVTTTAPNGDTVTTYTTTKVWKLKETAPTNPYMGIPMTNDQLNMDFNMGSGVGNSGMVWEDKITASYWALIEIGFNEGRYLVWEVQLKTGEIMWTAELL